MVAPGFFIQGIQKQLEVKELTYKEIRKAGKLLMSQKSEEHDVILKMKIDNLEQKWNEICKLSTDRQQKLDRIYGKLGI